MKPLIGQYVYGESAFCTGRENFQAFGLIQVKFLLTRMMVASGVCFLDQLIRFDGFLLELRGRETFIYANLNQELVT